MYKYAFKIEYRKNKDDKDLAKEIIFARDLKEAKRIAHEKYWKEKWSYFKVDLLKFNAFARYLRTSYKKLMPILDLIRKKNLDEAINIVAFIPRKAARMVEKLLLSLKANIEYLSDRYPQLDINKFYIEEIFVTKGPFIKRWDTKFRGMATRILKPMSHLTVRAAYREEVRKLKKEAKKEVARR